MNNRVRLVKDILRMIVLDYVVPNNKRGAWGVVATFRILSRQFRDIFTLQDLRNAIELDRNEFPFGCVAASDPCVKVHVIARIRPWLMHCENCRLPHFSKHSRLASCKWSEICIDMIDVASQDSSYFVPDDGHVFLWYSLGGSAHRYFYYVVGKDRGNKRIKPC